MVQLGDRVKDRISGFEGIVTGISQYLYGCKHVLVNPEEAKDGKPVEGTWLDADRLEVTGAGAVAMPATFAERAGGPMLGPTPPR